MGTLKIGNNIPKVVKYGNNNCKKVIYNNIVVFEQTTNVEAKDSDSTTENTSVLDKKTK